MEGLRRGDGCLLSGGNRPFQFGNFPTAVRAAILSARTISVDEYARKGDASQKNERRHSVRRIVLLAVFLSLVSSQGWPQSESDAKRDLDALSNIQSSGVDVDLVSKSGDASVDNNTLDLKLSQSGPECSQIYPHRYIAIINSTVAAAKASGTIEKVLQLPQEAIRLDQDFDNCLRKFGLTGRFVIRDRHGKYWSAADHMMELIKRGRIYQSLATRRVLQEQEIERFWIAAMQAAMAATRERSTRRGNCDYTWQTAADGSRCGRRAASVR